ncbi:uncharacterized protein ARMOST_12166 [Armillaria ostoyae]|uniref:Uncharacterized protein n=1 Tax=Armillaria ostoyae TaxID=47428 RepID=A0A284RJ60_ARMOS|nr:uncharacterized protein ARMOST_12166 [Armillaria ostoyae]
MISVGLLAKRDREYGLPPVYLQHLERHVLGGTRVKDRCPDASEANGCGVYRGQRASDKDQVPGISQYPVAEREFVAIFPFRWHDPLRPWIAVEHYRRHGQLAT